MIDERSRTALLEWFGERSRDLPWRQTRDPWAVLVAELMLQQTQVARVVPKYTTFLERFGSPAACAAAPVGDVVRAWAGLGYNRRAVYLHRAAGVVAARHGGRLPDALEELLRLPGVGPYTARAVLAFAFDQQVGVVDVNATRVLARCAGHPLSATAAQGAADVAVAPGRSWAWNQAMLDLGATVCTARAPRCSACPIASGCRWRQRGRTGPDPAVGSAGGSRKQSAFTGSDRQGRGRLVAALRDAPVPSAAVAGVMGWLDDPARAERVAASLAADGLSWLNPTTGVWCLA